MMNQYFSRMHSVSQPRLLLSKKRTEITVNPRVLSPTKLSLRSMGNLAIKEC